MKLASFYSVQRILFRLLGRSMDFCFVLLLWQRPKKNLWIVFMRFLASWLLTAVIKSIIDLMEILMDFVKEIIAKLCTNYFYKKIWVFYGKA